MDEQLPRVVGRHSSKRRPKNATPLPFLYFEISNVFRVKTKKSNDGKRRRAFQPCIIVKFLAEKELLLSKLRQLKGGLKLASIGYKGEDKVFINESLSPFNMELHNSYLHHKELK